MSKLARIFLAAIASVLVLSTLLFLTINNSFISPYYVHKQKNALQKVCEELSLTTTPTDKYIEYVEANEGVLIAAVPSSTNINRMNELLRQSFLNKGLGLTKFWLWEEDYANTIKNGTQQRIYTQENLGYNLLVQYLIKDTQLLAVATIIPHLSRPLTIANTIAGLIMGTTAFLLMTLVWWMSSNLERAQQKILRKNEQMKQLLNHVSHDLKTPISLIKAYASGMKDEMDDGTFLDTIIQQNNRMDYLTQRLLDLSKYENVSPSLHWVQISDLLLKEIERQTPLFNKRNLHITHKIQEHLTLQSNADILNTLFENLLSNARKYAISSPIVITLYKENSQLVFEISNPTDLPDDTKTDLLWEPFYTPENSRNSSLSGSGLGLALVRSAANSINATYHCKINESQFFIQIKLN